MKKKILIGLTLLFCLTIKLTFADSPVTCTDFYRAYTNIEIVNKASEVRIITNEITDYLAAQENPLELKAAVINALSWDYNGKTNAEKYVSNVYKKSIESLDINSLKGEELFCIGYLTLMDDYFHPEKALYYLELAASKKPQSFTIKIIQGLCKAQIAMTGGFDNVWQQVSEVFSDISLSEDKLNENAITIIMDYMKLYDEYTTKKDIKLTGNNLSDAIALKWSTSYSGTNFTYKVYKGLDAKASSLKLIGTKAFLEPNFVDGDIDKEKSYSYLVELVDEKGKKIAISNVFIISAFNDKSPLEVDTEINPQSTNTFKKVSIKLAKGYILVNGKKVSTSKYSAKKLATITKNKAAYIPIKSIIELLGGKAEWSSQNKKIKITYNKISIELWANKKQASLNGKIKPIKVAPLYENSNLYISLETFLEIFNIVIEK